jgi:hypothetical protein
MPRADAGVTAWSHFMQIPAEIRAEVSRTAATTGWWQRLVSVNRIVLSGFNAFERTLEDQSLVGRSLRPPAQIVMTRWLGVGNERVYPGREGWLVYRQDVEYSTRPGFLEPVQIERRIASAPEWTNPPQPDPRPAIVQLKRDLDARGIALIVMPTPLKPVIHPEMLEERYASLNLTRTAWSCSIHRPSLRRGGAAVRNIWRPTPTGGPRPWKPWPHRLQSTCRRCRRR